MSVALYRKYRSRSLAEVVGQEHVTTLLANALKSDQTAHAYLFTGPRGVGKTSIARILAHEINGLPYDEESTHLDIIEIDAASNNGVEDIRDLRDRVQIAPVSARKKVYIIDEVHMLSKQAFNALLKTLEEPPEHVVFILATTDIDKVPETIISRTQRHTFRRASEANIVKNLKRIAKAEKVTVDDQALSLVAKHADGSYRDSVSLFDQLISGADGSTITLNHITQSLGLVPVDTVASLLACTVKGDIAAINTMLTTLESEGVPPRTTAAQLADHLRRHITERSDYPRLIDGLLDVSRSQYPELKLLTTLGLFAPAAHTESAPTAEPAPIKAATASPKKPKSVAAQVATQPPVVVEPTPQTRTKKPEPAAEVPAQSKKVITNGEQFDWPKWIAYIRTHHVALHSVLSKCEPEVDGDKLRLYTKSAFYKKKLDETRYKTLLITSLAEIGHEYEIETVATAKPLKDSQAAQVAAIMGGGEEVSVDDA
ncbi:MAG: DNA polymerase III subunit gamma/tau [Patescibacteria group bacterium]